jgi:hypothetical protein
MRTSDSVRKANLFMASLNLVVSHASRSDRIELHKISFCFEKRALTRWSEICVDHQYPIRLKVDHE